MKQALSYKIINNTIPVFKCTSCSMCKYLESTNYLDRDKRGCCFYFPKYYLSDIKNIINYNKDFLFKLSKMKNAVIHSYYIEIAGSFDKEKYDEFMIDKTEDELAQTYGDFDVSLFFKKCAFITKSGCLLDYKLRAHTCNLYLCRHIVENSPEYYNFYSRERKDYFAYCKYIDVILKNKLKKYSVNLKDNFDKCISVLSDASIDTFSFSKLNEISFS